MGDDELQELLDVIEGELRDAVWNTTSAVIDGGSDCAVAGRKERSIRRIYNAVPERYWKSREAAVARAKAYELRKQADDIEAYRFKEHFGRDILLSLGDPDDEIVPVVSTGKRQAKARRKG